MKHLIRISKIDYSLIIILLLMASCSKSFDRKVKDSVNNQLRIYPQSNLQDIYKNFFQDRFGPGHLISDTAMAREYLQEELNSYTEEDRNPLFELTGWEENYYRVSLAVLKFGLISEETYLEAFVESANSAPEVSPDEWKNEWGKIINTIEKMNLALPDYESDKAKIQDLIDKGDFVVHHSPVFENTYHPHYRIIKKSIVIEKIKPLMNGTRGSLKSRSRHCEGEARSNPLTFNMLDCFGLRPRNDAQKDLLRQVRDNSQRIFVKSVENC